MVFGKRCTRSTAILLGIGALHQAVGADDGFIMQPRYRQTTPAVPEQLSLPGQTSQGAESSSIAEGTPAQAAAGTSLESLPQPSDADQSLSLHRPVAAGSSSSSDSNAAIYPEQAGSLRWLARGTSRTATHLSGDREARWNAPLELENPSFYQTRDDKPARPATPATPLVAEATRAPVSLEKTPAENPRAMLASMVSSQIIGDPRSGNESLSAPPVDAPPGWQAVGQELSQRIANCESLLRRNAFYSARQEAEEAALDLVRVLDLMANQYSCEPAWQSAMKAVSEAEDFSNIQRLTTDSDFLSRVIQSHETTVLKGYDVSQISPLVAAQHYRLFAQNQLREASLGHPWASEIFFALGRTYQAQADSEVSDAKELFHWRAVTLFRAAYDINPNNSIAANQLGYLYLQMDRAEDARSYLIASLNASPSIAAYENLIESSRRLGDQNTQQWALNQRAALSHGQMRAEGQPPAVVELDPRTFAAISPYTSGPQPYAARGSQPAPRMASLPSGQNNF